MSKARKPKLLAVHVTLLEMKQMPTYRVTSPTGARMALMRVADMPLSFYRYLYREVGKPHHWFIRRDMDDASLADAIAPGKVEIFVLYVEGCPAGFFELDLTENPKITHIHHFGLTPHYHSRGLGKVLSVRGDFCRVVT